MNPGLRALLTEVCKVMELIFVIPATTASPERSERSFSRFKLIKTPLRSTMKQWRLNHFLMVALHPELPDNFSTKKIADEYVSHFNDNTRKNCLESLSSNKVLRTTFGEYYEFSQLNKGIGRSTYKKH